MRKLTPGEEMRQFFLFPPPLSSPDHARLIFAWPALVTSLLAWSGDREFDLRSRTDTESRVDTALMRKRTTITKIKNRRITKERMKIIVIIIVILISTAERICYALALVINALQEINLPCQQQQS